MKRIICLYGGPGSGKSTLCAGLFYRLKMAGVNCEMNREYIKDWVWEGRGVKPGDQTYFFAKQARKERLYMEKGVDAIITDSPLILTHMYGLMYDRFEIESNTSWVMLQHHHKVCQYYGYKVDHLLVTRLDRPYNPEGRFQTEDEAQEIDTTIRGLLEDKGIRAVEVSTLDDACNVYGV